MKENNQILNSWKVNSNNWKDSIDNNKIDSRILVTNMAIIETVKKYNPINTLDLGCGEGWLTRELAKDGINIIGVDGTKELIENARQKGGEFIHLTYEEIINDHNIISEPFDTIILNFALFDKSETEKLLKKLHGKLNDRGKLFIQTVHPYNLMENSGPYISRIESNSWAGLEGNYTMPHEWYNRTLEDWISLFINLNYGITEINEPLNPKTKRTQSIIFVLSGNN